MVDKIIKGDKGQCLHCALRQVIAEHLTDTLTPELTPPGFDAKSPLSWSPAIRGAVLEAVAMITGEIYAFELDNRNVMINADRMSTAFVNARDYTLTSLAAELEKEAAKANADDGIGAPINTVEF